MNLDLDAIRGKLSQLQKTTQKQDNLWKPEPGKTQIRIVPYQYNKEYPFTEMYFHYDLGKKTYLSPSTYGNADPIVEFADKLKSTGVSDDWKMGKKLEPKLRTYVPIIVRGKESEGVKYWGFGKQIYQELLGFIADEDYGDITDFKSGRDVVVEYQKGEDVGNTYGKISIRIKPNSTPVTDDKAILEKIINGQKDLKEIFQEPSYDDLKIALQQWLNPDADTQESPVSEKPAAKSTMKTDDVSSAFEELFDEK